MSASVSSATYATAVRRSLDEEDKAFHAWLDAVEPLEANTAFPTNWFEQCGQRHRLAKLLKELTSKRESKADDRVQTWSVQAGLFGKLPADVVVIIVKNLLCLSTNLTCGVELHQGAQESVRDVTSLNTSCQYLAWCFRETGNELRLEFAARQITSLMPTNPASPMPYFEQILSEERSKLDIGILESALNSMLTHCCSEHCRGPLRGPSIRRGPSMPLLAAVLNGQKPRAKVVWPSNVKQMTVSAASDTCVLGLQTRNAGPVMGQKSLLMFKDEPSPAFNANTDLNPTHRNEIPEVFRNEVVDKLAVSPCGEYVAMTKRSFDSRKRHRGSLIIFKTGKDTMEQLGELRYKNIHLCNIWFRSVAETSPPNICFICYNVKSGDSHLFAEDFQYSFCWKSNGIYQFTLDGGFQEACEQSLAGISFQRILSFDDNSDLYALRPTTPMIDWLEDSPNWKLAVPRVFGRSAVMNVSVAAAGSCVAAIVQGRSIADSGHRYRCAQVVFYECPLSPPVNLFETLQGEELAQARMCNRDVVAISNHHVECMDMPWRLKTVNLSPCGDTAVVFQQARNGEFFVLVYMRLSPRSGFTLVRNMRLESLIQDPLAATPHTIRTLPTASVFSPCGRYLLVAFGDEPTGLAALRTKTGVCIFDVCGAGASEQELAFLECRKELVPEEIYWNGSGLWLMQRRGALLLGI